ncbi:MAG: hypothetical protein C4B58_11195 [Deltaproteobacteria bacterium]|nr:MAG: hypothetical protein C4B58_11195 [Deltaproteobacteria bacterium]
MEITHFAVKIRMLVNRDRTETEPRQKIFSHYNVKIGLKGGLFCASCLKRKAHGQIGARVHFSPNKCGF